jgi:hypothetical protein
MPTVRVYVENDISVSEFANILFETVVSQILPTYTAVFI